MAHFGKLVAVLKVNSNVASFKFAKKKKKKSETELTASVLNKGPKHTRDEKNAFNWTKQEKTCTFSRKSSFSSYIQHKKRKKQTMNSTDLLSVGCGMLSEGRGHETRLALAS